MIKAIIYDSGESSDRCIAVSTAGHGDTEVCMRVSALTEMYAGYMVNLAQARPDILSVQVMQGDGVLSVDAVVRRNDLETQRDLDVISWIFSNGMENIGNTEQGRKHLECEFLLEMPFGVSREDCLDCVREWRAENGVDLGNMRKMYPV